MATRADDDDNEVARHRQRHRHRHYYALDLTDIPEKDVTVETPAKEWLKHCVRSKPNAAFPAGAILQRLKPLPFFPVQLERCIGFALYFAMNVVPTAVLIAMPITAVLYLFRHTVLTYIPNIIALGYSVLSALFMYTAGLFCAWKILCWSQGWHTHYALLFSDHDSVAEAAAKKAKAQKDGEDYDYETKRVLSNQYTFTSRNSQMYTSMTWVWSDALHPLAKENNTSSMNTIFCMIPHGAMPMGVLAYPFFSKLFSAAPKLCHWTGAPVLFKLPFIRSNLKNIGVIPARGKNIRETLGKGESVGVILDGIAGMFQEQDRNAERAYIQRRKGIVAIAMQAGNCRIVPVYGFGHSTSWTMLTDPFGILERLSIYCNVSLVSFFGRFGIPFGPPRREKVTIAFGDPIVFKGEGVRKPEKEQVDKYHAKLVQGFQDVFDTHKAAYGWGHKTLKIV